MQNGPTTSSQIKKQDIYQHLKNFPLPCHSLTPKASTILSFEQDDRLVLPVSELYVNWIIQHVLFCVWLFHSIICETHPYCCRQLELFIFALLKDTLYEYTAIYLSTLLSTDFRVVSYFGIMKNAAMKILIHVLGCTFVSISEFVIYCCVTNYHKLSSLKEHTFIISQFLWVESPDTV